MSRRQGGVIYAAVFALAVVMFVFRPRAEAQPISEPQRIAKLEARVSMLEAALKELRGNIKEYRFSTAAGDFVCGRCKIEEGKDK